MRHDIDRAMFEMEQPANEGFPFAAHGHGSGSFEFETPDPEFESDEMELAAQLLEVTSEEELEQFIGDLVKAASSAVRGFAGSSTGKALGGMLRTAAKQALPHVGRAIGDYVAPGAGGGIGQRAGQWLGGQLELEGLSAEDQEFEVARAVVRLGKDATQTAVAAGPGSSPRQAAGTAVVSAAQRQLPGMVPLLSRGGTAAAGQQGDQKRSGRWIRRGRRIVLLDV
jgi:hypothetical protein